MTYLVRSIFGLKELDTYEQVTATLRKYTAYWCAGENYVGKDFKDLFQECLTNRDFGDIAQVYEVDTYFKVGKGKVSCGLYSADKDTNFLIRRIF